MGLYRSEAMRLYQLTVTKDDAWDTMNELGDLGIVSFLDLNKEESPYNLPYTTQVQDCEKAERRLQYLLDQCKRMLVQVNKPDNVDSFIEQINKIRNDKKMALNLLLEEI